MDDRVRELLLKQGFTPADVENEPKVSFLARWTPLSCAVSGTTGLAVGSIVSVGAVVCPCALFTALGLGIGSGWFFLALGVLTLTGGVTARSIYDRLYNGLICRILHTSPVPRHGPPRQFGCAIGGCMYVLSGIGFLEGNMWLAYVPAGFIITFAAIAGITQWCFASALYGVLFNHAKRVGPWDGKAQRVPQGSVPSMTVE